MRELLRPRTSNDDLRRLVRPSDRVDWSPQAGQQDSGDFTNSLISSMITESEAWAGDEELANMFTLEKKRSMQCTKCKEFELDAIPDNWLLTMLYLPAPSLHQAFSNTVFAPVRNSYQATCPCSGGVQTTFTSVVTITKYPEILILQLARFHGVATKDTTPLTVPLRWQPRGPDSPQYFLRSACLHYGASIAGGHYKSLRFERDDSAILVNN